MRIVRPDRLRLSRRTTQTDDDGPDERGGGRACGEGQPDPAPHGGEAHETDAGDGGKRRRELQVVVRVEVAAAEDTEGGGRNPAAKQQVRAEPARSREQREWPEPGGGNRQRAGEQVEPMQRRAGQQRVGLAPVCDDGVPPVREVGGPERAGRERQERAAGEDEHGPPCPPPLDKEQEEHGREQPVDRRLLDRQRNAGQQPDPK